MTEIEFVKDEGIIIVKPKKKNKAGYELEISFGQNDVCFSIVENGSGSNVQIDYNEFQQLIHFLKSMRFRQTYNLDEIDKG